MKGLLCVRIFLWTMFQVDDGFWEGELNGRTGVFPSLVVELVHDEGKKEEKQDEVRTICGNYR